MNSRFPLSARALIRWLINVRPPPLRQQRRVAGVMATKNYTGSSSAFETLRDLCDVTIVLEDNSAAPFPHRDECTELIAVRNNERWNAPANLTLLLYRAFVLGCEWVISLDDDIIPTQEFQTRRDVEEVVDHMAARRLDFCHFRLRDLWNSEQEIRVDGIWAQKTFPVVRRNWFFYSGITLRDPSLRLHTAAFPADIRQRSYIHPQHVVYHTGCLTREMREARVGKYLLEDPRHKFQSDYSYMLDDSGLKLDAVPQADLEVIRRKWKGQFHPAQR